MKLEEIKSKIKKSLDRLYKIDYFLLRENLCERCINHRFVKYLDEQDFGNNYFIDCEYNKSHLGENTEVKKVSNINGNYIDIIITKRDGNYQNDLVCFEIKKWNNYRNRKKDRDNLRILTEGIRFGYDYGFYIIFGKTREKTEIEIYQEGNLIERSLNN